MKAFYIKPTRVTPSIYFSPNKKIIDLRGKSFPENPLTYYRHLFVALDRFSMVGSDYIKTNIALEYFNTSSSKCLFLYLKKLQAMQDSGTKVFINWIYEKEDEDMLESGEDLCSLFSMPFKFIGVDEIKVPILRKK